MLQAQMNALDTRLQQNRTARAKLDTQRQEYDAAHERWQWVHALAATANGAIPGQEKITLEAFLQAAYFDRILGRANTRLLIMSGGQYELRRCERAGDNRSQTGLELEVVDHYNGTARSVKTLSGGETFAASLSLALGLSDEVQSSAGGVQLEAMFVDEGFGSLDSEALQQALTALVGVSGGCRIVGIISHVAELKEAHRPADHRHERPQRRQPRAGAGITYAKRCKNVPAAEAAGDVSACQKPRRVSPPQRRKKVRSFSQATCAAEKILLGLQTCAPFAQADGACAAVRPQSPCQQVILFDSFTRPGSRSCRGRCYLGVSPWQTADTTDR
ncbi:MAG: SbcC/MukB-like Walker B domain-containing protein [Oscillospiraceae bacterium]